MKDYILSKVQEYKGVFTERPRVIPCDAVVDAPITGNGDIGIALNSIDTPAGKGHPGSTGGGVVRPIPLDNAIEVYFTKNDFWKSCHDGMDKSNGTKSIGKLLVIFDCLGGSSYYAEQHIHNGTLTITLTKGDHKVLVTAWVLRGENVIVVKVTNEGEKIKGRADLRVTRALDAECCEHYKKGIFTITKSYSGPDLAFPTAAAAMTKIIGHTDETGGAFNLDPGEETVIVTAVVTNHDNEQYSEKAQDLLDRITAYWIADAFARHCTWWRDFWITSGVKIPSEPLVEKMWYGSHYIMACCCGNRQFPPGQFAGWVTTDTPNWQGDYHYNYNYEAPWWGLYSSNKIELTESYDLPLVEYVPAAREAAWQKLGCRGLYCLVGIGPKGFATTRTFDKNGNDDWAYWGQKSNASYSAVNMLMRFYSTYDLDYARNIVYPYLKEVGAFWEDYLVFKDGRYFSYNDCIHENSFLVKGIKDWAANTVDESDDCNPLISLGLIRMVFKGLLDMRQELQDDDPRSDKWRHILDHISPFPVQQREGKTVFRYTETGRDWCDGNSLGIQHVYPAGTIGLGSDKALLDIARNTLEVLNRWEDYNAFPTFYTAAARLGYDPRIILQHLNEELRKHAYTNMYVYYGGGGIECCSGVPGSINEMLLQSHEGILRFFPVWETAKDAEMYQLRAYGAFIVSGEIRNGTIGDITIYSEKGRRCVFQNPFTCCTVRNAADKTPVQLEENGDVCSFDTKAGECYILSSRD